MSLTKQAIDTVSSMTSQSFKEVRQFLEDGWTFSHDILGNMTWSKNVAHQLLDMQKFPVGNIGQTISRNK